MTPIVLDVLGVGVWSAAHTDWSQLQSAFAHACGDDVDAAPACAPRPSPDSTMPAAERRRTTDGVAVAIKVARQAVAEAGATVDPATLASVFASAHGDLATVDYLCRTLATDPDTLSPTRFHLSVHNAAAGYWSIAMRIPAPTNATAGGDDTFALGLLEAAAMATAESRPVLLVAFDTPAVGLLSASTGNSALFAFAVVVGPAGVARVGPRLSMAIEARACEMPMPAHRRLARLARSTPAARSLALAEALASGADASVDYPVGTGTTLALRVAGLRHG